MDCSVMLLQCSGGDQNIIQIHYYNIFCYKILEDIIYHNLKDGRTICHIEEYYQGFKKFAVCTEGSLLLITKLDADIIDVRVKDNRLYLFSFYFIFLFIFHLCSHLGLRIRGQCDVTYKCHKLLYISHISTTTQNINHYRRSWNKIISYSIYYTC